ncbi:hypothetical protein [Nostoc sp.]|uniref:hypothetical protein n=1 Tax=Nostoc sp. TaxID=1180 RepID=UPI002FFA520E
MTTTYTFNLRNLEQDPVTMWLFLAAPAFSEKPENVYQNSSTFLSVPSYNPNKSQIFKANVQYLLQTAQQSVPVKVGNQVISTAKQEADLNTGYIATYDSKKGGSPDIATGSTKRPPKATDMVVETNKFTPVQDYYNALTFGVITNDGMTGVTWVPRPNLDYAITPTLTFYIAVGSYEANKLAQIDATSVENAVIKSGYGGNFDQFNNTWVTYNTDGTWTVDKQAWSN